MHGQEDMVFQNGHTSDFPTPDFYPASQGCKCVCLNRTQLGLPQNPVPPSLCVPLLTEEFTLGFYWECFLTVPAKQPSDTKN